MKNDPILKVSVAILIFLFLTVAFVYGTGKAADIPPTEPAQCCLCENDYPYYAPCILELSTGKLTELTVFYLHELVQLHEGVDVQALEHLETDVMRRGASDFVVSLSRHTDRQKASAIMHITSFTEEIAPELYCSTCRKIIAAASKNGFVLVDIYSPDQPQVFALAPGSVYKLYGYTVSVTQEEDIITVTSLADADELADGLLLDWLE